MKSKTLLMNVDPEEHRSVQSPEEFAIEHRLVVNAQLHRSKAEAQFIRQLGAPLRRKKSSPPDTLFSQFSEAERAMFAIFGLQHFLDKRPDAEALLDKLNRSTLHSDRRYRNKVGYPNLSLAQAAFSKVTGTQAAKDWIKRYSYARTATYIPTFPTTDMDDAIGEDYLQYTSAGDFSNAHDFNRL